MIKLKVFSEIDLILKGNNNNNILKKKKSFSISLLIIEKY